MIKDIASLISSFKREAPVTWSDPDTDEKIKEMIEDNDKAMDHMLGAEIDYSAPGAERRLFLNYCLYDWNKVSEQFESAYLSDILKIRHKYEVQYEKQSENLQ